MTDIVMPRTYFELREAVNGWFCRDDLFDQAAGFIALAEHRLRRRLLRLSPLSEAVNTNWLLEDHPDVYLAATMIEAATWLRDFEMYAHWQQRLSMALGDSHYTPDPAKQPSRVAFWWRSLWRRR